MTIESLKAPFRPSYLRVRCLVRKHLLGSATMDDEWFLDRGNETLSVQHELDEHSLVFEVGAYKGLWASWIIQRYNPTMYLFEPVPEFCHVLRQRFADNRKVTVFPFGLGPQTVATTICVADDASSIHTATSAGEPVRLVDIASFVAEQGIEKIDLIQINIEGGEYELLTRMIDTNVVARCRTIQVQFHRNIPDHQTYRQRLRTRLSSTHRLLYDYPFVWEAWQIRAQQERSAAWVASSTLGSD